MTFQNTREFAKQLDSQDVLNHYQDQFIFPKVDGKRVIYFTGNSLGLQPKRTKSYIDEIMNEADTVFDKQASLVPLNKMGNDIILIDYKTIPKDYSILPEQLYWHDNYLYAGVYINSSYSKSKQYLIRLKKNNAN